MPWLARAPALGGGGLQTALGLRSKLLRRRSALPIGIMHCSLLLWLLWVVIAMGRPDGLARCCWRPHPSVAPKGTPRTDTL